MVDFPLLISNGAQDRFGQGLDQQVRALEEVLTTADNKAAFIRSDRAIPAVARNKRLRALQAELLVRLSDLSHVTLPPRSVADLTFQSNLETARRYLERLGLDSRN